MDAIVAVGEGMKTGAVGCVRDIAHPVSLARKVMEETEHCFLVADGAMKFAEKMKVLVTKCKVIHRRRGSCWNSKL